MPRGARRDAKIAAFARHRLGGRMRSPTPKRGSLHAAGPRTRLPPCRSTTILPNWVDPDALSDHQFAAFGNASGHCGVQSVRIQPDQPSLLPVPTRRHVRRVLPGDAARCFRRVYIAGELSFFALNADEVCEQRHTIEVDAIDEPFVCYE